jgi:hypothetical protein
MKNNVPLRLPFVLFGNLEAHDRASALHGSESAACGDLAVAYEDNCAPCENVADKENGGHDADSGLPPPGF